MIVVESFQISSHTCALCMCVRITLIYVSYSVSVAAVRVFAALCVNYHIVCILPHCVLITILCVYYHIVC